MQVAIEDLYARLSLLSSKSQDDKHEEIKRLIWSQYESCSNEDGYDFDSLRKILQSWAEKNNKDCMITHIAILRDLLKNIKQNDIFVIIGKTDTEENFDLIELFESTCNVASFFDLTRVDIDLKGHKETDVIVDITNLVNHFTTESNIKSSDIVAISRLIAISCGLCMRLNRFDYLTRCIFMPFISSLYKKSFTQDARNSAETFYLYLKKYDQNHLAFLIHAHLYSFQKSPYLTSINLTLSAIYALKRNDLVDEYVQEMNIIYLRMLRDAELYEYLEKFYDDYILKSNNEKLILPSSLIYVHSLFHTNQDKALMVTTEILDKYRELLFNDQNEAIASWLTVIFNLIKFDVDNKKVFILYIEMFRRILGEEKYNNLYSQIFSTETTAQILKDALPKVLRVAFDDDIGYDINNHVITAKELIKDAYAKNLLKKFICVYFI